MASIKSIEVRYYRLDAYIISWELDFEPDERTSDFKIELYGSEGPEGPFRFISRPSMNALCYIDPTVNTRSKNRRFYYRLKLFNISDDSLVEESVATPILSSPDLVALDVVRRERLLLKRYIKTKCYFYLARTFGTYCQNCYDEKKHRRTDSRCPICYGTGFDCGFFDPIEGYIDMSPHPDVVQPINWGPFERSETDAWTTNFPLLKVNDYIFEIDTGKRWRITQIAYNEKDRYITKQILRLHEEHRGSIIYDIKLPSIWIDPY